MYKVVNGTGMYDYNRVAHWIQIGIRMFVMKYSHSPFTVRSTSWASSAPSVDILEYLTPYSQKPVVMRRHTPYRIPKFPHGIAPISQPKQTLQGHILRFQPRIWLNTPRTTAKRYAAFSVGTLTFTPNNAIFFVESRCQDVQESALALSAAHIPQRDKLVHF